MAVRDFLLSFLPERQFVPWREKARLSIIAGISGPLLVGSMGASAILLFGLPASPISQPWAFIGGHLVSASIGIICARVIGNPIIAVSFAVGLSIAGMFMLRCLHPPGGAITMITVLGGDQIHQMGFQFLLFPVGINLVLMLALALLVNNYAAGRHYPARRVIKNPHQSDDPNPLARIGLNRKDSEASVRDLGNKPDNLRQRPREFLQPSGKTHSDKAEVVGQIMTHNVLTAQQDMHIVVLIKLLSDKGMHPVPIVNEQNRLCGMVTQSDLIAALFHGGEQKAAA
jgi:CBS domain-containing membrane protein